MSRDYIYMNTETVRALLHDIEQSLQHWYANVVPLRYLFGSLHKVWDAPATAGYISQGYHVSKAIEDELNSIIYTHKSAIREFEQWLQADAYFGGGRYSFISPFLLPLLLIMPLPVSLPLAISYILSKPQLIGQSFSKLVGIVSDPVDVTNGMFFHVVTDLEIPVPNSPYSLYRIYNSRLRYCGWHFPYLIHLDVSDVENIRIHWGHEGKIGGYTFRRLDDGTYRSNNPAIHLIFDPSEEKYTLYAENELVYTFDKRGQLVHVKGYGSYSGISFDYEEGGVIRLRDARGLIWATIFVDDNNRVLRIEDYTGHAITYEYDDNGYLVSVTDRMGETTKYEYSPEGFLLRVLDSNGQVILENEYDNEGRVLCQKDALGNETRFSYTFSSEDPNQVERVSVTYPDGTNVEYFVRSGLVFRQVLDKDKVTYTYDEAGRLVEVHDPDGKTWRFTWGDEDRSITFADPAGHTYRILYNEQGEIWRVEDPDGAEFRVEYDDRGFPIRVQFPDGAEHLFEYDERGLLSAAVDALGRKTTFAHDERGRIIRVQLPDGSTLTYTYDDTKGEILETDPLGRTTTYIYDANERLKVFRRDGHEVRFDYTRHGELKQIQDPYGHQIEVEYNPNGHPVRLRFPNGYTLRQIYDAMSRLVEIQDVTGRTLFKRTYDARSRLVALTDAKGRSWRYTYDAAGNLTALTDRKGRTFRFEYDDAYRMVRAYDAEGRVALEVDYDEIGLPRRMKDAEGHVLAFSFDLMGRLIATAWDDQEARAELDAAGQLVRLIDEKGRTRTYEYNLQGQLVRETYPLGQTYRYDYDPIGRLQSQTLPDGTRIEFVYDSLDRLVNVRYYRNGTEEEIRWHYSPDGRTLEIEDPRGKIRYVWDEKTNVLGRHDVWGQTVHYEFALNGLVRRVVYPGEKSVEYEYDENGNIVLIRDFAGHETHLEYDENDMPVRVWHPNGFVTHYVYDNMDRVILIRHEDADGHVVLEQRMTRDATGHLVDMEIHGPIAERIPVGPDVLSRRQFTFNDLDQIVESDEGPFRYDANGNLVEYVDNGHAVSLGYDIQDRLAEARIDADHFQYIYDAEGNRVAVIHNGQMRRYVLDTVLDLPRPLVEMDENGHPVRYFIWGQGLQYAVDAKGNVEVYLFNHRGDTLAVVDEKGNVVAAYMYAAYGQVLGRYGERDVPFRFLGRWGILAHHDNLYYIRARYYAPGLGIFTQPDRLHVHAPVPRILNRYTYALNEPWDLMDRDGRIPIIIPVILGKALLGGAAGAVVEVVKQVAFEGRSFDQIDWANVGASFVGGFVGGAVSTVVPLPIVGGAISGATGAFAEKTLKNIGHGMPWHKGVRQSAITGMGLGIVADVGSLALRIGAAGIGAWHHGMDPREAMEKSLQRGALNPWKRLINSSLAAYRFTRGGPWRKLEEAGKAAEKVLWHLNEDPLAPVTRQWWRFAKQEALSDLVIHLPYEKATL